VIVSVGVLSHERAIEWAAKLRNQGRIVVFTNGVFDLLHPGHVRYLAEARALGDALIVAVNSDRSARALEKGDGRPTNPAEERAEVVASLACVDAVVIFDEETPHVIVSAIVPSILVKGADWAPGTIIGADVVEAHGGKVVRIPLAEGYSTTKLIESVRRTPVQ
jgi:D-beta-D-heptose 7-phosphate kinase/D-beta-D-heptose 1-phosphate adenosyltransferase